MNILPFVLSFLLLMSLLVGSMLKEMKGLAVGQQVALGELHATQQRLSEKAEKLYKSKKKPRTTQSPPSGSTATPNLVESTESNDSDSDDDDDKSKRSYFCKTEWAKFQLLSIMDNPSSAQGYPAYEIAVQLVKDLYKHTSFWQEACDPQLAEKIINTLMKGKEPQILDRFANDPKLEKIFHLMFTGTNSYDVKEEKKKGYPPFFDYFTLAEGAHNKAIAFRYASYPVLQAAIGKELVESLKKAEINNQNTTLVKDAFKALIKTRPGDTRVPDHIEDLIYFRGIDSNVVLSQDPFTGVTSRLPPKIKK